MKELPPPTPLDRCVPGASIDGGRYRLVRKLQTGGNGVVWLARHQAMGAEVVIKFPRRWSDGRSIGAEQLEREAQALVAFSHRHPHVVKILDVGVLERQRFVVMQYLRNGPLHDFCAGRRRFSFQFWTKLSWLAQIASALDYLHSAGAVHRDVKPANILLDDSLSAHLADFGIVAERMSAESSAPVAFIVGSLPYLAPEVLNGSPASPAADQFALAATLFEFSVGGHAFRGERPADLIEDQARKLGDWNGTRRFAGLSDRAAGALLRALAPDPRERFSRCSDFAREFESGWKATAGAPPPLLARAKAAAESAETSRPEPSTKRSAPPLPPPVPALPQAAQRDSGNAERPDPNAVAPEDADKSAPGAQGSKRALRLDRLLRDD